MASHEVSLVREQQACSYRTQLWTHQRIADEMGVTRDAVGAMLKRVRERYVVAQAERIEQLRSEHTATLEQIAEIALRAFSAGVERAAAKSPGPRPVTASPAEPPGSTPEAGTSQTQPTPKRKLNWAARPDPRLLAEARAALADIRELWGANAPPPAITPAQPAPDAWSVAHLASLSDEDLDALAGNADAMAKYLSPPEPVT